VNLHGEDLGGEIWDRFTAHYTSTHGSWLDEAKIEISLFARQSLEGDAFRHCCAFKCAANAWSSRMNHKNVKINWGFTRKKAACQIRAQEEGFYAVKDLANAVQS